MLVGNSVHKICLSQENDQQNNSDIFGKIGTFVSDNVWEPCSFGGNWMEMRIWMVWDPCI